MTNVAQLTPQRVEDEIRRLSRRIETKADELPDLFQQAAEADVAYRVEYAKAVLVATGTVQEREAQATTQTARLLSQRRSTEAVADAARESLRATRDQLTACCSIGANLRAELTMNGPTYSQTARSA